MICNPVENRLVRPGDLVVSSSGSSPGIFGTVTAVANQDLPSVSATVITRGSIRGAQGPVGPQGPQGPMGPQGPAGSDGAPGGGGGGNNGGGNSGGLSFTGTNKQIVLGNGSYFTLQPNTILGVDMDGNLASFPFT